MSDDLPEPRDLSRLQANDFMPHINGSFRIRFTDADRASAPVPETLELTLTEVRSLPEAGPPATANANGPRAGFSLLFTGALLGPGRGYLPQRTYRVEHDTIGAMSIFLVPIGPTPDATAMRYQAIFN